MKVTMVGTGYVGLRRARYRSVLRTWCATRFPNRSRSTGVASLITPKPPTRICNQDLQPGVASRPAHPYPPRRRNARGRLSGHPQRLTMLELAPLVPELTGSASVIEHAPLPGDDPMPRQPDTTRAGAGLDGADSDAAKGLGRTVAWFRTLTESRPRLSDEAMSMASGTDHERLR